MIEIEKHIAKLLLSNDCVIIPNFGGFIAHYVSATYDENRNLFIPPKRIIGFNAQLTMNDSLLAQSFVEEYGISFPEAVTRIESDTVKLQDQLYNNGSYELAEIGTLTSTDDGNYCFTPSQTGFLTPDLYGLSSFEFHTCDKTDVEIKAAETVPVNIFETIDHKEEVIAEEGSPVIEKETEYISCKSEPERQQDNKKVVKISVNSIYKWAAACAAILIVLLIPAPVGNSNDLNVSKTSVDTNLLYRIFPKDITTGTPKLENIATSKKDSVKTDSIATMSETGGDKNAHFCIVMASRVTLKNAEAYVEKLHQKGMAEARVCHSNKNTKVVYGNYSTREEAHTALNKLNDNIQFQDCWITEIQ